MKITLYQPDIAQNLGTVMRVAACFGVPLGIIGPCGFPLTDKALRRSALDYGVVDDITQYVSWPDFEQRKEPGRVVLFTTKARTALPDFKFMPGDNLLFGCESAGVPDSVRGSVDHQIIIPISAGARSFNLATSTAIGLYEALRQIDGLPKPASAA